MACVYANFFMFQFEQRCILTPYATRIISYSRFVDDIFIIWHGDENSFLSMVDEVNALPSPIKLAPNVHSTHIHFLDVEVIRNNQRLDYTLFRKPTDRNTLLMADSFHPVQLKRSLPISQFLRVLRYNSQPWHRTQQIQQMMSRFLQRGYSQPTLQWALSQAFRKFHAPQRQTQVDDLRITIPLTYHQGSEQFVKQIRQHWQLFQYHQKLPAQLPASVC